MNNEALFSSKTDDWATPDHLFNQLSKIFNFTLDCGASSENAKCDNYYTIEDNALLKSWKTSGCVWMNPPYGRAIEKWMARAYGEHLEGQPVVCLVPARTDAGWWHEYALKGIIKYFRGRLKFAGSKDNAPFPSALIIYDGIRNG